MARGSGRERRSVRRRSPLGVRRRASCGRRNGCAGRAAVFFIHDEPVWRCDGERQPTIRFAARPVTMVETRFLAAPREQCGLLTASELLTDFCCQLPAGGGSYHELATIESDDGHGAPCLAQSRVSALLEDRL